MKKKENKKRNKVPVVFELPVDSIDMEDCIEKNRDEINDILIDSFEYAMKKNFDGIEVFSFKNSNYVVVVNRKDFRENLENIIDYSLRNEKFETCEKAKKVIELIDKFSFVMVYKKINKK